MEFSVERLAQVVGGRVVGNDVGDAMARVAFNISIDSRKIKGGEVFVPIDESGSGGRDGHDFIADAIAKGAKIFLTSRPDLLEGADMFKGIGGANGATAIVVTDTLRALTDLAIHTRQDRIKARVVGITGTVGKTSTKDLAKAAVGAALGSRLNKEESGAELLVHASQQSENNHLGVPLTICNAPKGVEVLLGELGASRVGEIRDLSKILTPEIGVVTSVGVSHIEGFGSEAAVVQAKGELMEALPSTGTAILNADLGGSRILSERTDAAILTYGFQGEDGGQLQKSPNWEKGHPDVIAKNINLDGDLRPSFQVQSPWGEVGVQLCVAGKVNVGNALAALTIAGVLGLDLAVAAEGLSTAQLSPLRMELITRPNGLVVINDSYNANPTSMRAALLELKALPAKKHFALLGTMRELGDIHESAHVDIARFAQELGIEAISYQELAYQIPVLENLESAKEFLTTLPADSAVLLKASRTVHLEEALHLE